MTNITKVDTALVAKSKFIQYGKAVIYGRAIPDIRDGLKPVHRAILYEMIHQRMFSNTKPTKVAKIIGAVIGNWHPHGDTAAEEALAGLAVPWKNTLPVIEIKGNQGSIFGDPCAAGRYIEAKLTKTGGAYGHKLKEGIVPYVDNFDDTSKWPSILPAQIPYTLINGISDGIAVGIATSLPTHNAKEVMDATIAYLNNPKLTTKELLEIMPGPDFPTGATIINKDDLLNMYETSNGKVRVRSKMTYDKKKNAFFVTEIPANFAGSMDNLVANLVNATNETIGKKGIKVPPKVPGVADVTDCSGQGMISIMIKLKPNVDHKQLEQILYAKTSLETTVKFNFVGLNDGKLGFYSLKKYLREYVTFQHTILINEYIVEKEVLETRMEIIIGRIIATTMMDIIINLVQASSGKQEVKTALQTGTIIDGTNPQYHQRMSELRFTERQAEAIADMKLYQLNRLDSENLKQEGRKLQTEITYANRVINDKDFRTSIIIERHEKERKILPDEPRKTTIVNAEIARASTLEIPETPLYVSFDKYQYVRIDKKPFDESIETTNKSRISFFDETGICWNIYLDRAKETKDRGTLINQLIESKENIVGMSTTIQEDGRYGLFVYSNGMVKRVLMSRFMTKTKATKVSSNKTEIPLISYTDIPLDAKTVTLNGKPFALEDIPLQGPSGKGGQLIDVNEQLTVTYTEDETISTKKRRTTGTNDLFDGVVVFDSSDTCQFDWDTLDTSQHTGLFVTTYQELIKTELLFVHADGTAKRVDGKAFEVKTKRKEIQSNKKGTQSIYIAAVSDTLYGEYSNGAVKKIDATKISKQGKVGGGIRAFYTPHTQLVHVSDGANREVDITSFATQPKIYGGLDA